MTNDNEKKPNKRVNFEFADIGIFLGISMILLGVWQVVQ